MKTSFQACPSILDASLDGLGGGAAHCVHAVRAVVLLVVQEPARIGQASHLYPSVSQALQQLRHAVHVEKDACAARAARQRHTTHVDFSKNGTKPRLFFGFFQTLNTYLLPARRRTFALSRPLLSRSFTTSCIISEPMKA